MTDNNPEAARIESTGWSFWSILKNVLSLGLTHSPVVTKFAIGALVIFAVASAALVWGKGLDGLLPAVLAVLVVGLIGAFLAGAVQRKQLGWLGDVLAIFVVACVVVIAVLFLSSAFMGIPERGAAILARWLDVAEILPAAQSSREIMISDKKDLAALPPDVQTSTAGMDRISRLVALRKKPDLVINGGELTIPPGVQARSLSVRRLTLKNGAIVTAGSALMIEVEELLSEGGVIRSFDANAVAPLGANGRSGGSVQLHLLGEINGSLEVSLPGERGADGLAGQPGSPGATGARGDRAASGAFDCSRGPGRGRQGQRGGDGGPGTNGTNGGDGGKLTVVSVNPELSGSRILFYATGGPPGAGGAGGKEGPGGPGGPGGSGTGWCRGDGPNGDPGPPGLPGKPGAPGLPGSSGAKAFIGLGRR